MLALVESSLEHSSPEVIVAPLLVAMGAGLVLWLLLVPVSVDRHRAALAATLLMVTSMVYARVARLAVELQAPLGVPVVYLAILLTAAWITRMRRPAESGTRAANSVLLLTVCLLLLPVFWGEFGRERATVAPLQPASDYAAQKPDVVILVLDGYGRGDVLRDDYNFENTLLLELRSRQFFVARAAAANYAQTALSLASAFNLEYLSDLGFPRAATAASRRGLADIIQHSRFFGAFDTAGYYIRAYASEYSLIRPEPTDERPAPFARMDDFRFTVFESTTAPAIFQAFGLPRGWLALGLHRRQVHWTLDHLARSPVGGTGPSLIFAHLLAPHPPFAFAPDGGSRPTTLRALINDGKHWQRMAAGSGEKYQDGYVDSVRFLNARVLGAVDAILRRAQRPTILLIHSDHGPGSKLDWENPAATDMRERLGVLMAARFPDGETPPLTDNTSLVNVYRAVLNRALGTELPSLPDRAFFSTWTEPYAYIDVTPRVNCRECN